MVICGHVFQGIHAHHPVTGDYSGYYQLVESYRNHCDQVCHRTILNAGYIDELTTDQLNIRSGEKKFPENYPGYRFQAVSYVINDEYQWVLKL